MTFCCPAWDAGVYVACMFKEGADGGAGITGARAANDEGGAGIPYIGGAMGAAGGRPNAPTGGNATPGWAGTPETGGIIGVAGGAAIPNIGDGAGGAGPALCGEGPENSRVYSLGPSCAGGAAGGGIGAEPEGAAGELNNLVYSPPPDGAGGGAGVSAGGALGLALEKALVIPPGSTAAGDGAPGIGDAFGGPEGVPNKRVNAPGSCWAGGGAGGGVAAGGLLSSSPPGLDSGIGDWKNRVNSPELSGAAGGGSELTGEPPGDRNILVNAPGSEGGATGDGGGGCGFATFAGGVT